jgi:hypothetical protein
MQPTVRNSGNLLAIFRIILAPVIWLVVFVSAMAVVACTYFSDELKQHIPVGFVMVSSYIVLGSFPVNLAIYCFVVEPVLQSKSNRTTVTTLLLVGIVASWSFVGLQMVDLMTGVSWHHKALVFGPFPFASIVTFCSFVLVSPSKSNPAKVDPGHALAVQTRT